MRDLYHDLTANHSIKPQTVTTSNANGTSVDLLGFRGALIIINTGAVGALQDGTNKCVFGIFESSDNSTYTAVADTDLVGGNNTITVDANAEANTTYQRAYIGANRYILVRCAVSGTISLPIGASIVQGIPIHA